MSITAPTEQRTTSTKMQRKVLLGGSIGQFVEFYDFTLYGLSAVILSEYFFPDGDRITGLLVIFATFGVAFVMRPSADCSSAHSATRWAGGRP